MALYNVVDRNGVTWDVKTAKGAAETRRGELNKSQPKFKPFAVKPNPEPKEKP